MRAHDRHDAEAATVHEADSLLQGLEAVRSMVAACMQCGTCSASCPNAHAMDLMPRQMWRLVHLGLLEDVFASRTFELCSACYTCQLRCPRGLELTEAMHALKRLKALKERQEGGSDTAFYRLFLESVRRHGRVHESALMLRYFLAKRDPMLPMSYTPLGLRMLAKGKLHLGGPSRKGGLEALFARVEEMEARS